MYAVFHFFCPLSCFVWSVIRSCYCFRCRFSLSLSPSFKLGSWKFVATIDCLSLTLCSCKKEPKSPPWASVALSLSHPRSCSPLFSALSFPLLSRFFCLLPPSPSAGGEWQEGQRGFFIKKKSLKRVTTATQEAVSCILIIHTHTLSLSLSLIDTRSLVVRGERWVKWKRKTRKIFNRIFM